MKQKAEQHYQIELEGHLGPSAQEWFDEMEISSHGANTMLDGIIKDQASLHGILNRIRDFNLNLINVKKIEQEIEHE